MGFTTLTLVTIKSEIRIPKSENQKQIGFRFWLATGCPNLVLCSYWRAAQQLRSRIESTLT
jgi:hypothetical protein